MIDIKPYVPFCDCIPSAVAPGWVGREAADRDEPLKIAGVAAAAGAEDVVARAYEESAKDRWRRRLAAEGMVGGGGAGGGSGRGGDSGGAAGGRVKHKGKRSNIDVCDETLNPTP